MRLSAEEGKKKNLASSLAYMLLVRGHARLVLFTLATVQG